MSDKTVKTKEKIKRKVTELKNSVKKKNSAAKSKQSMPNTVKSNRLELLVTIVARNKAEYYMDLIQSFEVNMQFLALAQGTADAKMLGVLGLTDSEKAVIFSVIQENKLRGALDALDEKFKTIKNGKGIAYTIPLTSVIGTLIYGFLSNNRMAVKETK